MLKQKLKLCLVFFAAGAMAFIWLADNPAVAPQTPDLPKAKGLSAGEKATPPNTPTDNVRVTQSVSQSGFRFSTAAPEPPASNPTKKTMIDGREYPLRTYKPLLVPNDPLSSQWWESNSRLDKAWDLPESNTPTLLAIIDTGFALGHEEFVNRWYSNFAETGNTESEGPSVLNCTARGLAIDASCNLIDDDGDTIVDNESGPAKYENKSRLNCSDQSKPLTRDCNQIDDDNNGYIDDVRGWDFINFDNSAQAGELNPNGTGVGHGTSVAGVAAASGNNSKGIAGVNWNTKILPLQALDDDSYGNTASVGRAILYAATQGADVISISLGSDLPDEYVRQAIESATAAGSLVVAASGNDGCDCMVYPANYPEVIAVGALDTNNLPASFSSWGTNLDILAPGTQMDTPVWLPGNGISGYAADVAGTSFATPLVSGLLTRLAGHQPGASPLQLVAALTENTQRLSLPAFVARDDKLGYGAVDGFAAVRRMNIASNPNQIYAFQPVSKGDFSALSRSEVANPKAVYECSSGTAGTTPLYELYKDGSSFFSVSRVELKKAQAAGYTAQTFGSVCMQQPHDNPQTVRSINLFKEFRNLDKKVY